MEDVDPVEPQPRRLPSSDVAIASRNAAARLTASAPWCRRSLGRLQLLQHAAEIGFRLAVAIQHRGVEIVHAGLERARHRALLVGGIAAHHQPAHRAAAEAQHRDLQSGPPECPHLHCHSPISGAPSSAGNFVSTSCGIRLYQPAKFARCEQAARHHPARKMPPSLCKASSGSLIASASKLAARMRATISSWVNWAWVPAPWDAGSKMNILDAPSNTSS